MNEKNLIPNSQRSPSELRAMQRKGGINSGKARRRKKSMREWAEIIGALGANVICPDGKSLKGGDLDGDVIMQQYRKAHNGDTRAAAFIAGLKGELKEQAGTNNTVLNINTSPEGARNIQALATDPE